MAILSKVRPSAEWMLEDNDFAKSCLLLWHLSADEVQYRDWVLNLTSAMGYKILSKVNTQRCKKELFRRLSDMKGPRPTGQGKEA